MLRGKIVRRGKDRRVAKLEDTMEQVAPVSRRIDAGCPAICPRSTGTRKGATAVAGTADEDGSDAGAADAGVSVAGTADENGSDAGAADAGVSVAGTADEDGSDAGAANEVAFESLTAVTECI